MKLKFIDLFESYRGSNSKTIPEPTEEVVYSFCQDIISGIDKVPVLSGATQKEGVVGYVPNYLTDNEIKKTKNKLFDKNGLRYFLNKQDCITMVRCGDAGKIFYRSRDKYPVFTLTTSIFAFFVKPIDKIRQNFQDFEGLDLKWFSLRFNLLFNNLVRGDGLSTIPLSIINNIELEIPSLREQEEELLNYEKMYELSLKSEKIIERIEHLKEKHVEEDSVNFEEVPAEEIFETISGNSGLTEEYIYSLVQIKERNINFIGGSLTTDFYKIPLCRHPKNANKTISILEDKEGLLVIRKGRAGRINYLNKGNYATNDDAYIFYLNKNYERKINLRWIKYQYTALFLEFSSSSDNGTWNKTNFMKQAKIKVIPLEKQEEIVYRYETLENLENELRKIQSRLNRLFEKELII